MSRRRPQQSDSAKTVENRCVRSSSFFGRYEGLDEAWDALVIEGYSGPATAAIRHLRRRNPRLVVAHWCLDTYPSLAAVAAIPADAWLTNSRLVATRGFAAAARALRLPESGWYAEADRKPRFFAALAAPEGFDVKVERDPHLVVYLGQPAYTKKLLAKSLRAVAASLRPPARLEVYGSAWDRFADDADYAFVLDCCWKGVLESGAIAALYGRAAVILGTSPRGYSFDESRRRRCCDVDIPWEKTSRGAAAAASWIFRGRRVAAAAT